MADLARLVRQLDRPPRRPRGPAKRTINFSVALSPHEFDLIEEAARRQNLAVGAALRDFALTSCLHERERRRAAGVEE